MMVGVDQKGSRVHGVLWICRRGRTACLGTCGLAVQLVRQQPPGSKEVEGIGALIQRGARTFLRREYTL